MRRYLVLYIEKDSTVELLSVFPSLPRLLFRFSDSEFRIPDDSGFWNDNHYVLYTRTFS